MFSCCLPKKSIVNNKQPEQKNKKNSDTINMYKTNSVNESIKLFQIDNNLHQLSDLYPSIVVIERDPNVNCFCIPNSCIKS